MPPSPPESRRRRPQPLASPGHGNVPATPTAPTVTAPYARARAANVTRATAARYATTNPARSPEALPRTRCPPPAAPGHRRSRHRRGSGIPPPAPTGCPANLGGRPPGRAGGSLPPTRYFEPGPDRAASLPAKSPRCLNARLHTGTPAHPVAASRTPLVMILDSQTQTISLILQDQRGTALFWRGIQDYLCRLLPRSELARSQQSCHQPPGGRVSL